MVNFKAAAFLLSLATSAIASALPRDVSAPLAHAHVPAPFDAKISARGQSSAPAAIVGKVNGALYGAVQQCQPHVYKIQQACKNQEASAELSGTLKVELGAIIEIFGSLKGEIQGWGDLGSKVEPEECNAALTAFLKIWADVCIAIGGSGLLGLLVDVVVDLLGAWCNACIDVILALNGYLIGAESYCGKLLLGLGITLELVLKLRLTCLLQLLI